MLKTLTFNFELLILNFELGKSWKGVGPLAPQGEKMVDRKTGLKSKKETKDKNESPEDKEAKRAIEVIEKPVQIKTEAVDSSATPACSSWSQRVFSSLPAEVKERFKEQNRSRITTEGVLVLDSQRFRDQPKNVADCLEKLHAMLLRSLHRPRRGSPSAVNN